MSPTDRTSLKEIEGVERAEPIPLSYEEALTDICLRMAERDFPRCEMQGEGSALFHPEDEIYGIVSEKCRVALKIDSAPWLYEEALMELGLLLQGVEPEFKRRVLRLLIKQSGKFVQVILTHSPTDGASEWPLGWSVSQCTERMHALIAAAREPDTDRLAIIEHEVGLPLVS